MFSQKLSAEYFIGRAYPEYFLTPHWKKKKEEWIYTNPKAKCWLHEETNTLLPHHERYTNLFHERLNRDVFILCFTGHSQLHFYTTRQGVVKKVPLTYRSLKRRRLLLRLLFVIQNRRFGSTVWYLFRYLFCL